MSIDTHAVEFIRKHKYISSSVVSGIPLYAFIGSYLCYQDMSKSLVIALLAIAIALAGVASFLLYELERKYILIVFCPVLIFGICAILWKMSNGSSLEVLFWISIVITYVLVILLFVFAYYVMVHSKTQYSDKNRYSLIMLCFSVFISVAVLLGFAVGFHDRSAWALNNFKMPSMPGLIMLISENAVHKWSAQAQEQARTFKGPKAVDKKGQRGKRFPGRDSIISALKGKHFVIWFKKNSSDILFDEKNAYNYCLDKKNLLCSDTIPLLIDDIPKKQGKHKGGPTHPMPTTKNEADKLSDMKEQNAYTFAAIIKTIMHCNGKSKGVHLTVQGLTSVPESRKYNSNVMLSRARALRATEKIFSLLSNGDKMAKLQHGQGNSFMPRINTIVYGASYDTPECNKPNEPAGQCANCLSARVWVRPYESDTKNILNTLTKIDNSITSRDDQSIMGSIRTLYPNMDKPPSLLDYIYFSVYTITTTAYGDIVPVSPQAKFVTILANIYEVVFLVIIINILMSRPRNRETMQIQAKSKNIKKRKK